MKTTIQYLMSIVGRSSCGIALAMLMTVAVCGQDATLSKELDAVTKERNSLRAEVQNVDVKLEGAQRKLQELMRRQAPYADIQFQKERIQGVQREKLKLMTKLLEAEQKRADLLVKTQELNGTKNTTAGANPNAGSTDPTKGTFTTKPKEKSLSATMDDYRKRLADMKQKKLQLLSELQAFAAKRKDAETKLATLPASAPPEDKAKLEKALAGYKAGELTTKERLDALSTDLSQLQGEFERYVASRSKDDYIMPGQKLELIVAEDKTFNGEYTVRAGGYVILDRVGRVKVAGKSREDAELAVKEALEKTQLRIATVLLEAARMDDPKRETEELQREYLRARIRAISKERADIGQDVIYLYGAFAKPGPWPIPKNFKPTVLTTIIRAGGTAAEADLSAIRVLRMIDGKTKTDTINIKALMEGKAGVMDIRLQPNDIIVAPNSPNLKQNVFLTGSVKKPGAFELSFDKPMTTYTILLKAGGVSRFANLSKVYILREKGKGGQKIKIPANLQKVKEGKLADPELKPNDIIVVPESFGGLVAKALRDGEEAQ